MKTGKNGQSVTKTCICSNGDLGDIDRARTLASGADLLIAADGGARYIEAMGLKPHMILGDMDSIREDLFTEDPGVRRITFPRKKDQSDTELAVRWALEQGAETILLLGCWGGRPDHTLGNTALMVKFPGILKLWDDGFWLLALTAGQKLVFQTTVGAVVSMFPFDPETRISTTGLEYNLNDENLKFPTHGLSNFAVEETCSASVTRGLIILCMEGGQTWPQL